MKDFKEALCCEIGNDFNLVTFNKICEYLENNKVIWLYCWCAGHTKCEMVKSAYLQRLYKKYGDNIRKGKCSGWLDCYYLDK